MMQPLPHQYQVTATGKPENCLTVSAENLANITVAAPTQFGGPGDQWSPEDLFMASISSCFILSFSAVANVAKLKWSSIECHSQGVLDKVQGKSRFTKVATKVTLNIDKDQSISEAERLLHKADQICLVTNSLTTETALECVVARSD